MTRWTEADLRAYIAKGKTPGMAKITHQQLQSWVVNAATMLNWRWYHTWISIHSAYGFPDLVLVRPPRLIFAEIKTEDDDVTEAQDLWLTDLAKCPGTETYLWRPADLDRIGEILK